MLIFSADIDKPLIYSSRSYFNEDFEPEWMTSSLAKEIVLDIDKSVVIEPRVINGPIGYITHKELSGGAKGLILLLNDYKPFVNPVQHIYSSTIFGDNCAKWLLKLAETRDIEIQMHHIIRFWGLEPFEIYMKEFDRIVNTPEEYTWAALDTIRLYEERSLARDLANITEQDLQDIRDMEEMG